MASYSEWGLVRDVATECQKIHILITHGKAEEARTLMPKLQVLGTKCLKSNISFCFFIKRKALSADGQYFSETLPMAENWPSGQHSENNPSMTHVHIIFSYTLTWTGHVEMRPEGIDVDYVQYPPGKYLSMWPPNSTQTPPDTSQVPPPEGGIITPREMEKFLKDFGLGDIDKK